VIHLMASVVCQHMPALEHGSSCRRHLGLLEGGKCADTVVHVTSTRHLPRLGLIKGGVDTFHLLCTMLTAVLL
jgi:hypothetical protein